MPILSAPQRTSDLPSVLQHLTPADGSVRQTFLDRLAMRAALGLLLWSTRPRPSRSDLELLHRARLDRDAREREWERRRALLAPRL
ncbi:hypothetical protein AB3M83_08080 [Microbacterium sp. 179-B 1A2 NHS]|uniref:hypothetical protein n=1 Tax=Microbacterium sp. 179-B 1A2 NHS TaxID=3142383 RepID=UPI0039A0FD94